MSALRWFKRAAHLQGHAVDSQWLWTVQWMLGVLGVFWAMLIGVFLYCGGAGHLTGELYKPLIAAFRDYHVIGAVNIAGGVIGIVGLARDARILSITSASVCATWNGLLAMFTIPANWSVPGGGNLVGIYALFVMLVYALRFVLLVIPPKDDAEAVKLR